MADASSKANHLALLQRQQARQIHGVVMATLMAVRRNGRVTIKLKAYTELELKEGIVVARSAAALTEADLGCDVAVMFERGERNSPIVIGRMERTDPSADEGTAQTVNVQDDAGRLTLSADREIVLQCGKATITLTRAGKILLKGAYLLSRSSGLNRILGGAVQIN